MEKQPDVKKRVEQFYRLLADYGLTGKTQPLNRQKRRDIDKLFPE
jgi:hypothetical protein